MTEIETFRDEVATYELRWKCRRVEGVKHRVLQQKWKIAYGTGGGVVYTDEWRDVREEWES
jgi:hypothetical protein